MPKLSIPKLNQSGYMIYFLIVGIVAVMLLFLKSTYSPMPTQDISLAPIYCREVIQDPNTPRIDQPAYTSAGVDESRTQRYKLVKKAVPVSAFYYADTHHFFQPFKKNIDDPITHKKYMMKIPNGENGQSYPVPTEDGINFFKFADYGLIYLFHLKDDGSPLIIDKFVRTDGVEMEVAVVDIYIADDKTIPDWVLKCIDAGPNGQTDGIVYERDGIFNPSQNPSKDREQLQLEYFLLNKYKLLMQAWWTPHCKPAIYLYPPKPMLVNVKIRPDGFLTYVDPLYDSQSGWNVLANPDGKLINQSNNLDNLKQYDYLYFESKIRDQLITHPTKGWVMEYNQLGQLYNRILPLLGFNPKQQADFIEYWQKNLPYSPYYFVGVVNEAEVNTYEELKITPQPDKIKRIRFYFEARTELSTVESPDLSSFVDNSNKNGQFSVFEWGGMLKRDKDHEFTCSM